MGRRESSNRKTLKSIFSILNCDCWESEIECKWLFIYQFTLWEEDICFAKNKYKLIANFFITVGLD
jgi:hypothetical protein